MLKAVDNDEEDGGMAAAIEVFLGEEGYYLLQEGFTGPYSLKVHESGDR